MGANVLRKLADEALLAMGPQAGQAPALPTVGRIVHYYNKHWFPTGPYAAVVSGVTMVSESAEEIKAKVDLSVFTNNQHQPVIVIKDVSVVASGELHDHDAWWMWPERS